MRRCRGTLSTNLEATEVIRLSEHAESCPVNPHAFYHHQQLAELRRLASEDTGPVMEIYNELASNASNSSDTAAYFPSWEQAQNAMYYSRAKIYQRLPARRQDLRLTAEKTTTTSGAQFGLTTAAVDNVSLVDFSIVLKSPLANHQNMQRWSAPSRIAVKAASHSLCRLFSENLS
ncbi:conserved hypothetical protein [Trichinella spiralis]|uniref:hypothetical protein n=1 Tax=Trichinella spiralis TaxID=6334 RepID=UPI0001EFBD87|nr:conserved hypothetical protein [Trichinella spiralis]